MPRSGIAWQACYLHFHEGADPFDLAAADSVGDKLSEDHIMVLVGTHPSEMTSLGDAQSSAG